MTTLDGPRLPAALGQADALVVLLHGYGADGNDLFGLAEPLSQVLPSAAFVSPNAPEPNQFNPMGRQWFPIPRMDGASDAEMTASFERSVGLLDAFLDAELAATGVAPERLALVGFSQGAMMSLHVGPRRDPGPAAICAFSGRLLVPERLAAEAVSRPPVLLVHGDRDDVVPFEEMTAARAALGAAEFPLRWHVSRGIGHGIAPDGLQAAAGLLTSALVSGDAPPP